MAITLDGTTGITTPGLTNTGTETIVNLTTTGNTILGNASTDTLNVGNGDLVKDASGNVGIGVTPPSLSVNYKHLQIGSGLILDNANSSSDAHINFNAKYTGTGWKRINAGYASQIASGGNGISFATATTSTADSAITWIDAMTLDASGNLFVGQSPGATANKNAYSLNVENGVAQFGHISGTVSTTNYISFNYNAGSIGSISQSGTTAVLYNTTSDYRLKENVTPIQNALSTITALNPVSFTWIDGRPDDGFLAHELQVVLPNCVTGEKDAVNEDGTPKYQQMDNSGVVPFLVKAIQELTARLEVLEAK